MLRTATTLLAASLSLALLAGCTQEASSSSSAGDAASGLPAAIEQVASDANAANATTVGDAPLKPGERVQGTIQLDVGHGAASFRSLAVKVDDDLGKKTAKRLASAQGHKDLAGAQSKIAGGTNVSAQDIQETADIMAGKTYYTSEMSSLAIANLRFIELSGISADGRKVKLNISFAMDSDLPTEAKLEYVPDGENQMQSFEAGRNDKKIVQVTMDRFERVDDHTISISGTFTAGKMKPTILAKNLAGQEIAGAAGSFDFTEIHLRPEQ